MWIGFIESPLATVILSVVCSTVVSLWVFKQTRQAARHDQSMGPLLEIVEALDAAEVAVVKFHGKYSDGYVSDEDFVSDATVVFSRCSAFLSLSRDIKKRIMLSEESRAVIDKARENLVRELLAVQYGSKKQPFPHAQEHLSSIAAARGELERLIVDRP